MLCSKLTFCWILFDKWRLFRLLAVVTILLYPSQFAKTSGFVRKSSSVSKTCWKFTFAWPFAQSILPFLCISFSEGRVSRFEQIPQLKIQLRVDFGTSGAQALPKTSSLVWRRLRWTSLLMARRGLSDSFRSFLLSEAPLHWAGLMGIVFNGMIITAYLFWHFPK